jgi:hypothetical protein
VRTGEATKVSERESPKRTQAAILPIKRKAAAPDDAAAQRSAAHAHDEHEPLAEAV